MDEGSRPRDVRLAAPFRIDALPFGEQALLCEEEIGQPRQHQADNEADDDTRGDGEPGRRDPADSIPSQQPNNEGGSPNHRVKAVVGL
jgi:hypothetical protein